MSRKRVLVIDDSAYNRKAITDMLQKTSDIEVVGIASDGEDGLKRALKLKPDIITLDLEMPVMDGFTFLRILMVQMPTPVIVVSSRDDDVNVFKALELGAVDFLAKPSHRISRELFNIEKDLISKIRMVSELKMDNLTKRMGISHAAGQPESKAAAPFASGNRQRSFDLVAIGSSTGGPPALQSLFTSLPKGLPVSIVVSQHMPPGFTRAFSERLNRLSEFEVKEAEDGDKIENGRILIAPGGHHMTFANNCDGVVAQISRRGSSDMYAPSVDRMFISAARKFEERLIGVVLTGMGNDGKEGVIEINNSKGVVLAESEETSIVFGMPREAIKTGVVDKVLPLDKISGELVDLCGAGEEG